MTELFRRFFQKKPEPKPDACNCGKTIEDWMNPDYPATRVCPHCELFCGVCKNIAKTLNKREANHGCKNCPR